MTTNTNMRNKIDDETVADKAQDVAEKAEEKVGETMSAAKEKARHAATQAAEQAKSTVDTRMSDVAEDIDSVADAVRQTSQEISGENEVVGRYGERIAEQLDGISSYLNEKGVEDVLTDLQDFARRQPAVFLGGAFMIGMVVGRFVRSSGERNGYDPGSSNRYGSYSDDLSGASYGPRSGYSQSPNRYTTGLGQESTPTRSRS